MKVKKDLYNENWKTDEIENDRYTQQNLIFMFFCIFAYLRQFLSNF